MAASNENTCTKTCKSPPSAIDDLDAQSFKTYRNDRQHLLKVFPEEVWQYIFEKIQLPSQLENVSNASLFFRELLLPERTQFMFGRVWRIMEDLKTRPTGCICMHHTNPQPSSVATAQRLHELLKLRLVCNSWCGAVDNYFQTHPNHHQMSPHNLNFADIEVQLELTLNVSEWVEKFGSFLDHFQNTHGSTDKNPFIDRTLSLSLDDDDNDDENIMLKTKSILQKYGHHIWHCTLSIRSYSPETIFAYLRMREILCLMPNLQVLSIKYIRTWQHHWELTRLSSAISSSSLPTLERLQKLRCFSLPNPVFRELLCRNSQVATLEIVDQPQRSQDMVSSLQNLRTLGITFPVEFGYIRHLPLTSQITNLYLWFTHEGEFDWGKLYRKLEHGFKNTLTFLHVHLGVEQGISANNYFAGNKKYKTYKLDLPHLNHVELRSGKFVSLDVLLPVRSTLEVLDVSIYLRGLSEETLQDGEKYENGARINFFACVKRGRPLESNIWTAFPQLKRLHFKYCDNDESFMWSHSRREWHEEMKGLQNNL